VSKGVKTHESKSIVGLTMTTYLESLVGWWWLPIWNHQSILRVEERTTIRYRPWVL